MHPVAPSAAQLQAAAAEAERLAQHLPNRTFRLAAERLRKRAEDAAAGKTPEPVASDPIALFCLGRAA